jgi:hypothetical protein
VDLTSLGADLHHESLPELEEATPTRISLPFHANLLLHEVEYTTTMSGPKRPATDAFGSSQLVKRAKSDANLGGSSAVAVVNGSGQNGALIQSVCRNLALG